MVGQTNLVVGSFRWNDLNRSEGTCKGEVDSLVHFNREVIHIQRFGCAIHVVAGREGERTRGRAVDVFVDIDDHLNVLDTTRRQPGRHG